MKLVSALAIAAAMTLAPQTPAAAQDGIPGPEEDSYIWLEEARSDEALDWVRAENERTMKLIAGDPRFDAVKAEALAIYDSEDRIPYVTIRPDGLYNFWQDKQNPRGLVRRTTLESYRSDNPQWETVLDVDALAEAEGREWVYKGSTCLPPEDRLCMIALSDGGDTAMRVLGQEALAFSRARPGSGAAFLSELWRRTERASEGVCELTFFYGCTCCGRAAPAPSRRGRPRERGRGVEGGASSSSCVRVCRSEHSPREIKRSFSPSPRPPSTAKGHGALTRRGVRL